LRAGIGAAKQNRPLPGAVKREKQEKKLTLRQKKKSESQCLGNRIQYCGKQRPSMRTDTHTRGKNLNFREQLKKNIERRSLVNSIV